MNNKKTYLVIAVIICVFITILIAATIIRSESGIQRKECELYFINEEGTSIVAETKEIKYRDENELPRLITEALIRGPENSKLSCAINKDAQIIGIEKDDFNNLVINFTSEYLSGDTTRDVQSVYAVVKSLCTLDTVRSVKVIVEGIDIPTADGGAVGYLTAEDINLSTDTYTTEMQEISLYFSDKDSEAMILEPRIIRVTDQKPIEQYIISELIKGPVSDSLIPVLNKKTTLISVDTVDGICFVNFDSDFIKRNSGGEKEEKRAIYAIVNSLTEMDNINGVQFLINGKKTRSFGSMDLLEPYFRN